MTTKGLSVGLSIILVIALLLSLGIFAESPSFADDEPETFVKVIDVLSNQPWTDTGIIVFGSDTISITASGTVTWDSSYTPTGPDGTTNEAGGCSFVVTDPAVPARSLVGNIAPFLIMDGKGFFVGSNFEEVGFFILNTTQKGSGRLFLGFNDDAVFCDRSGYDVEGFEDNDGSFSVTIQITRSQYIHYSVLTVNSTVGGTVYIGGGSAPVTYPLEGVFPFQTGNSVNLRAYPDPGYRFVNWTGDVATINKVNSAITSIGMGDDYTITANFAEYHEINIDALLTVNEGSDFTAILDIDYFIKFSACNYDISFDPAVLRLDAVASGESNGTAIPVDSWNEISPGIYTVVQSFPGPEGVTGPGYLAVLHFHAIGSPGDSTGIYLSNGNLLNSQAEEIPASWKGDGVYIIPRMPGDANDDGQINVLDITRLERIIAGVDASTSGADANQDGNLNAQDITRVEMVIVELNICSLLDNEEAENMALFLSGELHAPGILYQQIVRDLEAIRSEYGNDIGAVNDIEFLTPWSTSSLHVCFDEEAVSNPEHPWHVLSKMYRLTEISRYHSLYFACRLHPRPLSESYIALPDVTCAISGGRYGDSPNIYPRLIGDRITYLFRHAWGDCPCGCIYSEYWYFTFNEENQPVFVGHWNPQEETEQPGWWSEARLNIEEWYKSQYIELIEEE